MVKKIAFIGLLACLLTGLDSWLYAQKEHVYRIWGTVFGKADTPDDFLIYDATIPDFDTTRIYIAGLARNGNAFPLQEKKETFFYKKDSTTDAFLACFSIYGELLWSTWLPPAQIGYINGFASCVRSVSDTTIIVVCNDYEYQADTIPLEDFQKKIPIAGGKLHLLEFHKDGKLLREKAFTTTPSVIPPRIFDIFLSETDTNTPLKLAGHYLYSHSVTPPSFSISDGGWYSLSLDWTEQTIHTPTLRSSNSGSANYSAAYYLRSSTVLVNYIHFGNMNQSFAISQNVGQGELNVGFYGRGYYITAPQKILAPAARYDLQSHFAESWKIHNEDTGDGFQYYASPSYNFWNIDFSQIGHNPSSLSGTVQNTQKVKEHYIVQGVHCKDYQNGFFRKGDNLYAYSHNESVFPDFENERNPQYTAAPFMYIYDKAFENPTDSTQPIWGTFLDMDWYFEDFFFRTDLSRPRNLFMPYDPALLISGNKFFLIGNTRKIGGELLTSGSSDTTAHHQGIILAFSIGCPSEKTAFQDVRFLCPDDSVELKLAPDYTGFKFRFDPAFLADGSIVLNADSSRVWAKKEGLFAATLDGSSLGCPDAAVDTVRISLSPYPEPVRALNPDSTVAACAAVGTVLQAVTAPDSTFSYRWFDGDTVSPKTVRFAYDSLFFASVEVNGYCSSFRDSTRIRFLPPYVALGKDSLLCTSRIFADTDVLLHLNARQDYFPDADWIFHWQINGRGASENDSLVLRYADLEETGIDFSTALITVAVSLSDAEADACTAHDTLVFSLASLPKTDPSFLPQNEILCAHRDLELLLPDTADNYRCYWLDQDSVLLPYGYDTNRFTITGMRGTDGFGANTDTRTPRFFQLKLDHKLCGVSFFDTLLVYDQVKPTFELPVHDTIICLNEPIELDSLNPFVYRPFYGFEWNDGTKGSGYTFTDSGLYILRFFMDEDFAICGYAAASDTVRVRWSNPALTLINIPSDTSFCEKLSVVLDASVPFPSTRYSWQEGNLDDLFSPLEDSSLFTSPIITVDKEVSLALFVVDTMGCVNTRQIEISEEDCKPSLSVPNVFTPNGDGVNDVLRLKQVDYCYDVDILIVDRKGTHVLHEKLKNPDDFAWNGCLRNGSRKLPDGAYFYFISYKNAYGKKKYQSGSITILGSTE